ncbi:hypothetical protein ACFWBN_24490 [Streptomyces sp. NPDC059989]|uniref:hypothetical protein n=1 Tax=Streptomyces sp. NPDC059989 TaxID=3347026 RepID=UPI00369ECBD1
MFMHALRRRMCALGTVLGLGIVLPLATGATPASAQAVLTVTKTHEGNFARGGEGVYIITVTNTGNEETIGNVRITDNMPLGLTRTGLTVAVNGNGGINCPVNGPSGFACDADLDAGTSIEIEVTVAVSSDAPCTVTNTVSVSGLADQVLISASDPTTITGTGCGNGNGGGGDGSILPVDLNGVVTAFNNISTNNNLLSPGATNTTNQNLGINAP